LRRDRTNANSTFNQARTDTSADAIRRKGRMTCRDHIERQSAELSFAASDEGERPRITYGAGSAVVALAASSGLSWFAPVDIVPV
jgi:hypothetical protein